MSWVNRLTFELTWDYGPVQTIKVSPIIPGGSPGQNLDEALRIAREEHGASPSMPDSIYATAWSGDPV